MTLKRRDFLKIAGGLSLGFPLYTCSLDRIAGATSKSAWLSPVEGWIPTVCQACPGGCGILVRTIGDRAVKVEGNPLHPLNKGRVCPKGQAGLQLLYNPDRIRSPLKRTGDKGEGKWQSISWEEAFDIISSKLQELRNSGKSHTVAFIGQDISNTTDQLIAKFLEAYGTPNDIKLDDWVALKKSYYLTHGFSDLLAYDLEKSRYILSFGADFLNNWPTSMENQRIYGEKRAKRDLKIVQIEPRFSLSASRADAWIPINPGTEGLLALGVSSIIIKEELYNQAFLKRFTSHFEDFEKTILREIRLDHVSELTGVSLQRIIEIAKEFSTSKPAVAVADYNLSFHPKGLQTILAVHTLNALVGNIDLPGGLLRQRKAPLRDMPSSSLDEMAEKSVSKPRIDGIFPDGPPYGGMYNFIQNSVAGDPYEVNSLFILNKNLHDFSPNRVKIEDALRKIPFIVYFSPFMNETSIFADIILPESTYLEKWQEHQISSLSKIPIVSIGQPVVKPLYESKPSEDIILSLAQRLGSSVSQNFPWRSFKELLIYRLKGLFEAQKGSVFSPAYEEAQLRLLEERGWWTQQHATWNAFLKDFLEKGGWQDPSYHFNERSYMYQTSSRRFEFPSIQKSDDILFELPEPEGDYPFLLQLFDLPFTSDGQGKNIPWHQETVGFRFKLSWKTWVEMNPESAKELGIQENESVWVESSFGKIKAVARIFAGIMPHVVGIPLGKKEDVPLQQRIHSENNPLKLLGEDLDEQTGMYSRRSTRVKIYKSKEREEK